MGTQNTTRAKKPKLCNQVRELFKLEPQNKTHFTRNEMVKIVSELKNIPLKNITWDGCVDFMEEELAELGWSSQNTVDTHPTIVNLNWLISKKERKQQKQKEEDHHINVFTKWSTLLNSMNLEPKQIVIDENRIVINF